MSSRGRAISTLAVVAAVAVPLAAASVAFACARLATLKLDRKSGTPGTQVSVLGRNFNNDAKSSPVQVRFNSRRGRILATERPNRRGIFKTTFTVPRTRAGWYVIVATQQTAQGRPAAGTPGRSALRVLRSRRSSSSAAVAALPPGGGSGGGLPAPPGALIAVLALGGTAGAGLLLARRRPAAIPSRSS